MAETNDKRILIVDDNEEIHKDYIKILSWKDTRAADQAAAILFGTTDTTEAQSEASRYRIDSAFQGQEALEMVRNAVDKQDPYAVAFIDIRMPPGWDGIETIKQIRRVDSNIQIVICSAYSDHSWKDITTELGESDNLLILKKPFEMIEISQLALALTKKWELLSHLYSLVKTRTSTLENLYSFSQATLESIKEGVLAVGLKGNILAHNNNFLKQFDVSESMLKSESFSMVVAKLSENIKDPILFLKRMNELINDPRKETEKEWELHTGQIFELSTSPQYLKNEIVGIVLSFQDITERKKLEKTLLYQATHDILTTLPNRALFLDRLHQAITHAKRFNLFVAVLQIDLDYFKDINDTLGHKAGDAVLIDVANRMFGFFRESDTIARFGGDEFTAVIASQIDEKNFIGILRRFSEIFSKPFVFEGREMLVTSSVGVSIYPRDGINTETLLKNADIALYQAKSLGRNRVQFYLEQFNKIILEHSELKASLNHALEKNELSIHYQPLVDLKSERVIGLEALLRWSNKELGNISPQTFIPIAEESGLIIPIGTWVLKTACQQVKLWQSITQFKNIKLSVNISCKQFEEDNFVTQIKKILEETQFDPNYLELEITEGLILANVKKTTDKMVELKKIGVHFAIDDFGTGYSTLSYIKYFQFDTVKIDKTFINNINTDPSNASIVQAIIGLTKSLGMNVLAEGVEQPEQVAFLQEHHTDQVQGFYYSKPLNEKDCEQFLMDSKNKKIEIK